MNAHAVYEDIKSPDLFCVYLTQEMSTKTGDDVSKRKIQDYILGSRSTYFIMLTSRKRCNKVKCGASHMPEILNQGR